MANKKGQVAIWVILALVLAGAVLLFFFIERRTLSISAETFEPQQYMEKCTSAAVNEAVDRMLPQGGFLQPTNFKSYNYTNVSYLCQHTGYFAKCVNQHPMLIDEMTEEIRGFVTPRLENCFEGMKAEVEKRDGSMEMGPMTSNISMSQNLIIFNILRDTKITERGQTETFSGFDVRVINPAYDLANIAIDIANNEAKYCHFMYQGYMALYPRWDIRVAYTFSDSTKIYSIKDKKSGKVMNIAIRSCAMPSGMGI